MFFLLKFYRNRDCGDASKSFIQIFEFIDNNELWKVEKIINKIKNKKDV